ncbi:hypothetical protein ABT367_41150, partial [Streptomyces mesophilus]
MSRRVSLPGADELFRTTGGMALQSSSPRKPTSNGEARVPAPAGESDAPTAPAYGRRKCPTWPHPCPAARPRRTA